MRVGRLFSGASQKGPVVNGLAAPSGAPERDASEKGIARRFRLPTDRRSSK